MKPIDIVFVCWGRPKITELAIKTIRRNTRSGNYRLNVIDNGSGDEQQAMLQRLADEGFIDQFVFFKENKGLEYARNHGLFEMVRSDYFICADNDCLPEPEVDGKDWVERLVTLLEANPLYAAISCRTQVMIGTGNIFEEADNKGQSLVEFAHPGGSLRIMKTEVTRQVGGWRDDNPGRGSEERYICGKLHDAGYKTGFATFIKTLHLFGVRAQGTDRWGYPEEYKPEDTGHSDIWHPSLANGDDLEEVKSYAGEKYAVDYFKA